MSKGSWLEILAQKLYSRCGYFENRWSEELMLNIEDPSAEQATALLEGGFRRYGKIFYRSECPHCRQCMSYRVLVEKFNLTKSLKRVLKKNRDLIFQWAKPYFTISKARLYLRYLWEQHRESSWNVEKWKSLWRRESLMNLKQQLYTPIRSTLELTVYLNALLVGFAIFDVTPQAVSAVYSVYDTSLRERSLGTAIILEGWRFARKNKIPYYYLGYYIPDSRKMNYKKRFRPAEIRDPDTGEWVSAELVERKLSQSSKPPDGEHA
ncbi:MAG: arginyltransferase [Leptospiraceae bacterium]|nr:arginyltransferase [Leptospiraceae bacterium]MDW8306053.1 arginyltransferase [Leptospiraceae bacterium]